MGKLSTLAMVNEMGVISLTTYGALIYFMVIIILKSPIRVLDHEGKDSLLTQISATTWHKHYSLDAITVEIERKNWTIPVNNILAIIE